MTMEAATNALNAIWATSLRDLTIAHRAWSNLEQVCGSDDPIAAKVVAMAMAYGSFLLGLAIDTVLWVVLASGAWWWSMAG
jgi:hypothetical protein